MVSLRNEMNATPSREVVLPFHFICEMIVLLVVVCKASSGYRTHGNVRFPLIGLAIALEGDLRWQDISKSRFPKKNL